MGIIEKSPPPPSCKEDDILKVKVLDVKVVKSKFDDDEGNPQRQMKWQVQCENGYKSTMWGPRFYERPGERSIMGKMVARMQEALGKSYESAHEFLEDLRAEVKCLNVKVKGFREYDGDEFPTFRVSLNKFPMLKTTETPVQPIEQKSFDAKTLLLPFAETIKMGLPLSDEDLTKIPIEYRAKLFLEGYLTRDNKTNLNHAAAKATQFFQ